MHDTRYLIVKIEHGMQRWTRPLEMDSQLSVAEFTSLFIVLRLRVP
jgi:hypothetical protein